MRDKTKTLIVLMALAGSVASCGGGSDAGSGGTPTSPTPSNRAPVINSMTVNPTFGVSQVTSFAMTTAATDPDGDAITYAWDFGDGTSGSGSAYSKMYAGSGVVTVRVTARDARGASASDSRTVTVGSAAGVWSGTVALTGGQNAPLSMTLSQNGAVVTGTLAVGALSGRSDPAQPGSISTTGAFELRIKVDPFSDVTMRGTMDPSGRTISGGWFGSGFNGQAFQVTKQ